MITRNISSPIEKPSLPTLEDTVRLVASAHRDQKDKGGMPYLGHVLRVFSTTRIRLMRLPDVALHPDDRRAVLHASLLHDVIEDTTITADDLYTLGYGDEVVCRVERLSGRPAGTSYIENIEAMVREGDVGVMLIKLCDNDDNNAPARIAALPESERSISLRYERSIRILSEALASHFVESRP